VNTLSKKWIIAVTCIWAAIVFLLHVVQIESEQKRQHLIPHADKVIHFTMFAILALGVRLSASLSAWKRGRAELLAFFVCMAYGACLEYLQGTALIGRDCDPLDWFADISGACLALVGLRFYSRTSK
jgi:VanZ family protein